MTKTPHQYAGMAIVSYDIPGELPVFRELARVEYSMDGLRGIIGKWAEKLFGQENVDWKFRRTSSVWPLIAVATDGRVIEAR